MKIRNLKIGTRLTIGFMLVIMMTLAAGGLGLHQMSVLAGLVTRMYNHPLTVGYTMRDIRSEIDQMHDQMQRLLFVSNAVELDDVERHIDSATARVMDKFALVMERFLGDTQRCGRRPAGVHRLEEKARPGYRAGAGRRKAQAGSEPFPESLETNGRAADQAAGDDRFRHRLSRQLP
jgi:hypothetical protein